MKRWLLPALVLLGLTGAAGVYAFSFGGGGRDAFPYRIATLDRGPITASVRATGTLTPVSTVLVGSQLSGLIVEILADFNSQVKANQVVARLFSEQIKARRDAAQADVEGGRADVGVRRAQLERARATRARADANLNDLAAQRDRAVATLAENRRALERQQELFRTGAGSRVTLDAARTQVDVQTSQIASIDAQTASARAEIIGLDADIQLAQAQLQASDAALLQRQARLKDIEIDLGNTEIRSPVDGVVVQRQIELGQTVAASLSAPTLFTIAQDLREIEIYANVDEADVGRIRTGQRVTFSVNAYPSRTFEGQVKLVRLGAQTVQNVVTYTGVISVNNADLALLPGMTANLQVITDQRNDVTRIPNAALRFKPVTQTASISGAAPGGQDDAGPFAGGGGGQGGQRAAQVFRERLLQDVRPTPDQLRAIDQVLADGREHLRAQRQGASPEEIRRNAQQQRRDNARKIGEILDPERRARFEKMTAELGQAARQRQQDATPGRIFVIGDDGQPRGVDVRLGVTDGAVTELVAGGLNAGDSVIIGGGPPRGAQPAASGPPGRGPRLF